MPLNVALTGNVAAGKSSVTERFARWGATVIDADAIVRQLQAPGGLLLDRIKDTFGAAVVRPDGSLDRAALRGRIVRDAAAREQLNRIVHPAVALRREELMREAADRGDAVVVNDIPLLFEVMDPTAFDMVVLVDAPAEVRRRRLIETRGIPPADTEQLMAAQLPADAKRHQSDAVIDNDLDLEALERRAWMVWQDIRRRAARHLCPGGASRRLLAVFAHPDDEALAAGGTLARYADAQVTIQLICATAGEAASGTTLTRAEIGARRIEDLHRSAAFLGIDRVEVLELPDGALVPDDPASIEVVGERVRFFRPDTIITFGPDGITRHSDHVAVHAWMVRARAAHAPRAELLGVGYPDSLAGRGPPEVVYRPARDLSVRIDVRPWADRKRAAIAAHATVPYPLATTPGAAETLFEYEWFAPDGRVTIARTELFPDARERA